jgi:hypothetical protein
MAAKGCPFLAALSALKIPGNLVLKERARRAFVDDAKPALLE